MKILKKLLLFGLFSFAFCITTKADVILPELPFDKENTSYIVEYNQQSKYVFVGYCKGTNYSLGSTSTYSSIGSPYVYGFRYCINENGGISEMYRRGIDLSQIESDIYNDSVDLSSYSWGSEYSGASYGITLYYVEELERLQILSDGPIGLQPFYNNPIIDANMDVYLRSSGSPYGIKVFDKSVLDNPIEENVCDRTAVLGAVSNVNDITLNVKGDTSVFYPLKGTFTLNYTSNNILSEENFLVEFINNSEIDVVGNYTFKCATDSNKCYLNYEYSSMDDIIETIDFSFKIRLSDNSVMPFIKIYACATNDDYTNISYDYTNASSDSTTSNPGLDNYLNDLTPPSSDISSLGNIQGILPEGPVDGLLNIPFKVMSILIDGFNGTCRPISFNFVFDMPLTFPCVGDELYNHMDSTLMLFVNIVPTAFILIKWFKNLYVRVQRATSLETTTDDEWGGI